MTAGSRDVVFELHPETYWERRADGAVVAGGIGSGLHLVDESVVDVLDLVDGTRPTAQVVADVARRRMVEPRHVDGEVRDTLEELERRGLVHRNGRVERTVSRSNRARFAHLFFELTSRCNLRCKHCYMEGGKAKPVELRLLDWLDLVEEFTVLGGRYLTLSGGEPLLYRSWPAVASAGADAGLTMSLMTNGTYLDARQFATIAHFDITVGLGLDGFTAPSHDFNRGRGSFAQTMRALDLLLSEGYAHNTTICFTPMRHSIYDLPALIDMMLERGLPRLYISLLEARGRAERYGDRIGLTEAQREWLLQYLYEKSLQTIGRLQVEVTHHTKIFERLLFGRTMSGDGDLTIRIPSDGEVYLSAYMGAPEHCVGRVGTAPLARMLESDTATAIVEQAFDDRTQKIPKCRTCVYKKICGGGSGVLAYSKLRTFNEPDEYCDSRIALFDSIVRRELAQVERST